MRPNVHLTTTKSLNQTWLSHTLYISFIKSALKFACILNIRRTGTVINFQYVTKQKLRTFEAIKLFQTISAQFFPRPTPILNFFK